MWLEHLRMRLLYLFHLDFPCGNFLPQAQIGQSVARLP